jgi:Dolichyl-phosphate-mannose-protein mannosyltransferase
MNTSDAHVTTPPPAALPPAWWAWLERTRSAGPRLARATAGYSDRLFGLGVAACTAAVGTFLVLQLTAWPPHEDETLALFVGRSSVGGLFDIVLGQRGGAPLHFLLAWLVAHTGGGLTGLRLLSAAFATASVPVIALLCARLSDRITALTATAIVSASWTLLFHGIYGRMYSLFLLTSALSCLLLLRALERGDRRSWVLWAIAMLATVATHPYGLLVFAAEGLYVVLVRRVQREPLVAFAAVFLAGIPLWRSDLVLAGRFDVGVGGHGQKLGGPISVFRYLRQVAGDFTAGYGLVLTLVLVAALLGLLELLRTRPRSVALAGAVMGVPTLAFLVAKLGSSTAPESRHLIFALPFFALLVAAGGVAVARRLPWGTGIVLTLAGVAALLPSEVAWGWHRTPPLFTGEARLRIEARGEAAEWLAATSRPDDVLFAYDPLYEQAWERSARVSRTVVPRADAKLALRVLRSRSRSHPLGRGVWVLDRSDTNNFVRRLYMPLRVPEPRSLYEVRSYGPFLIVRTRKPTLTPRRFLEDTRTVMLLGKDLYLGDADINYDTSIKGIAALDAQR